MADIIASSPLAKTINLTRSIAPGSIFGGRRTVAANPLVQTRNPLVQPREKLLDPNELSLRQVSNQLSSLTVQMNDIGGALERIAFYIAQDTSLENLKTKQDQVQEKQLAEEGLRTRQESIIERKIKSALIAPVQAIAQKTQSVLSRLMDFFGTLFTGWLTLRGIDTLKALSEGNTKKLEEIRDSVLKNLGIAGATLLVLNGGFFAIIGTIGSITLKLTAALGKFLFLKPLQFIANLIKGAIKNIIKPASTAVSATASATATAAKPATGFLSSMRSGVGSAARGALGAASRLATPIAGIFDFSQRMGEGQSLFQAAAGTGGSLAAAAGGAKLGAIGGSFFGPVGTAVGAGLGGAGGFIFGGAGMDILTGANKPKTSTQTPSNSTAQTVVNEKGQTVTVGKPYPSKLDGKEGTVTYDKTGKGTFSKSTSAAQPQTPMASSVFNVGDIERQDSMTQSSGIIGMVTDETGKKIFTPSTPATQPQMPMIESFTGKGGMVTDETGKKIFTPSTPATQPQMPMAPSANQFQFNVDTSGKFNSYFNVKEQDSMESKVFNEFNLISENLWQPIESRAIPQAQIAPLTVSSIQRTQQLAAPLPEAKPTVVMARTSSGQQEGMGNQAPSIGGPANNVPAISSSNPENFYTLYSQVHYNVVV